MPLPDERTSPNDHTDDKGDPEVIYFYPWQGIKAGMDAMIEQEKKQEKGKGEESV